MIRQFVLTTALAASGPSSPPARDAAVPLQATGQWTVHAEDNLCALSRSFGKGDAEMLVGFQPIFTNPTMEVIIVSRDRDTEQRIGKATLRFAPSGTVLSARYFSLPAKGKGHRYTRITITSQAFDLLQSSSALSISARPVDATILVPRTEKAVATFRQCETDLLRSWKVDPEAAAPGRAARMMNPGRAFSSDHYPLEALSKGSIGRVVVLVQVDADGRPTACRTVVGVAPSLNEATCTGAMKRVKYLPGQDAAGQPAPSVTVLAVNWQR